MLELTQPNGKMDHRLKKFLRCEHGASYVKARSFGMAWI
jgi:hypothetical protein